MSGLADGAEHGIAGLFRMYGPARPSYACKIRSAVCKSACMYVCM